MDREEDVTIQAATLSNEPADVPIQGAPAKVAAPPLKALSPPPTKVTALPGHPPSQPVVARPANVAAPPLKALSPPPTKVTALPGHPPSQPVVARPAPAGGIIKASEPAYRACAAAATRAITESEQLRSKPWLAKKYEDCARATLVACDSARCTSKHDPLDLEDFTPEELRNRCVAFPVQGGRLSCYRPENLVRAWAASTEQDLSVGRNADFRVRDPLTNTEYCRDGSSYYDDLPDHRWRQPEARAAAIGVPVSSSLRSEGPAPFVHQSRLPSQSRMSHVLSEYRPSQPRIASAVPTGSIEGLHMHRSLGEEPMAGRGPEKTSSPIRAALQAMRRQLAQVRQEERVRARHPDHSPRTNVSLRLSLQPPRTHGSQGAPDLSEQRSLQMRNQLLTEELYEAHARQRRLAAQSLQATRAEKQAEQRVEQREEKQAEQHTEQRTKQRTGGLPLFQSHPRPKQPTEARTLPPRTVSFAAVPLTEKGSSSEYHSQSTASSSTNVEDGRPDPGSHGAAFARALEDPEDQMRLRARGNRRSKKVYTARDKPVRKDVLTKKLKTFETLPGRRKRDATIPNHSLTKLRRAKLVEVSHGRLKTGPRERAATRQLPSPPSVNEDIVTRMNDEST